MFSIPVSHRLARPFAAALAFIFIFILWNLWHLPPATIPSNPNQLKPAVAQQKPASHTNNEPHDAKPQGSITHHHTPLPQDTVLPCAHLPSSEDILVILKTGATEIHRKLPMHFSTTFRCIRHYAIYSDMAEEIDGHPVYDALDEVDEEIKRTNPDFELYHQAQEYRAKGKAVAELFEREGTYQKAWNLDKWKFLPLMDKALKMRPRSKWYVFIEADTSMVWSNLLEWLAKFNPEEPLYIGGQSYMGSVEFAHGGTGFIVSNPALRMVTEKRASNLQEWDQLTAERNAGDSILAEAFKAVNISLTRSWPVLQGETPYTLDYTEHHWCFPVVSYHHMPSSWIKLMWNFEQSWISTTVSSIFPILIYPSQMTNETGRSTTRPCATATFSRNLYNPGYEMSIIAGTTFHKTSMRRRPQSHYRTVGSVAEPKKTACNGFTAQAGARPARSSVSVSVQRAPISLIRFPDGWATESRCSRRDWSHVHRIGFCNSAVSEGAEAWLALSLFQNVLDKVRAVGWILRPY